MHALITLQPLTVSISSPLKGETIKNLAVIVDSYHFFEPCGSAADILHQSPILIKLGAESGFEPETFAL